VILEFIKACLEGLGRFVGGFIGLGNGDFGAETNDGCPDLEDFGVLLNQVVDLLLLCGIVAEDTGKEGLLLVLLVDVLFEECFDGHEFLVEHRHLLFKGIYVDLLVVFADLAEDLSEDIEVGVEEAGLFVVEGLVAVDVVLAILNALLEAGDQVLGVAVIVEVLDPVDEVGVLREVQVLAGLALLAHLSAGAVFKGADERDHLLVTPAHDVLTHIDGNFIYNSTQTPTTPSPTTAKQKRALILLFILGDASRSLGES
jgi:hypothetical protein